MPEGTSLYLNNSVEPVTVGVNGHVVTRPFGWGQIGIPPARGIPYRLEKNGKTVKEGRLRSVFRGVSLFWPPVAIAYWPTGLNPNITYNLIIL